MQLWCHVFIISFIHPPIYFLMHKENAIIRLKLNYAFLHAVQVDFLLLVVFNESPSHFHLAFKFYFIVFATYIPSMLITLRKWQGPTTLNKTKLTRFKFFLVIFILPIAYTQFCLFSRNQKQTNKVVLIAFVCWQYLHL